jgi:hypothetical protein
MVRHYAQRSLFYQRQDGGPVIKNLRRDHPENNATSQLLVLQVQKNKRCRKCPYSSSWGFSKDPLAYCNIIIKKQEIVSNILL